MTRRARNLLRHLLTLALDISDTVPPITLHVGRFHARNTRTFASCVARRLSNASCFLMRDSTWSTVSPSSVPFKYAFIHIHTALLVSKWHTPPTNSDIGTTDSLLSSACDLETALPFTHAKVTFPFHFQFSATFAPVICLQCFDAVDLALGRAFNP